MKKLGIIGGLGPMATIYFMELVVKMTKADSDADHIPMVVYSFPDTPDRTQYLLDNSKPNPLDSIIDMTKRLNQQDVDYIAMPCITAHYFGKEISNYSDGKFVNMVKETAKFLKKKKIDTVGIMATDGTIHSKVFENVMKEYDIKTINPSDEGQKIIMDVIYNQVKAGKDVDIEGLYKVKRELKSKGAKVCILGCTELSVVKGNYPLDHEFVDVLEVLAGKVITLCGAQINKEYKHLFK